MNQYRKGQISNAEVIEELLKMAAIIAKDKKAGEDLGLNTEEKAFYDALLKPAAIKDFYTNDALIQITKELTEMLSKTGPSTGKKKNRPEQRCAPW